MSEPAGVIAELLAELTKLPGIGPKSAERIALDDVALIPLYSHIQYRVANTKAFVNIGMDYIGYPVIASAARR